MTLHIHNWVPGQMKAIPFVKVSPLNFKGFIASVITVMLLHHSVLYLSRYTVSV